MAKIFVWGIITKKKSDWFMMKSKMKYEPASNIEDKELSWKIEKMSMINRVAYVEWVVPEATMQV